VAIKALKPYKMGSCFRLQWQILPLSLAKNLRLLDLKLSLKAQPLKNV